MSKKLKKADSIFKLLKQGNQNDCINLFKHLNYTGVELFCELLYFIINGDFELKPSTHVRLKKKIKNFIKPIKKLITPPKIPKDLQRKKRILKQKKIIDILIAIATASSPIINQILLK